jgi:alkylation response protein AidB-like acyl-CoA dehydrogenase
LRRSFPEQYGGAGLPLRAAAVILEEIHASGCNAGACHAQMYIMGTLLRHGNEQQKRDYLPKIASGELRLQAFGVTEPTTGSDTTKLKTRAVRDGDHYVIHGQKVWTSRALYSDVMLLLARTTPLEAVQKKTQGLSVFLVDVKDCLGKGMEIRPLEAMINHHATEVFFDGVRVPAANLIGEEGKGFSYILDGMNAERILVSAEAIGDGRWFTKTAVAYSTERIVFDRPIGKNQAVQFPIARAYAEIEAADLLLRRAAALFEAGPAMRQRRQHREIAGVRRIVARRGSVPAMPRRIRLRSRVRRRAQVARDPPVPDRADLDQHGALLRRRAHPGHAPFVLEPVQPAMAQGLTHALAEFVARRLDPPADAVRIATNGFIDTVATMAAGQSQPVVNVVRKFVRERQSVAAEASILWEASLPAAPMLRSSMARRPRARLRRRGTRRTSEHGARPRGAGGRRVARGIRRGGDSGVHRRLRGLGRACRSGA